MTERLGGGAMGEVWRAADRVLERQVAVKIVLPALLEDSAFAERFRREARMLAALNHRGIVDIHDYGEQPGADGAAPVAFIVMELLDGQPLDRIRAERGTLPVEQAMDIVAQALDALHAAHQQGIVHRDIKPSNLMLRADGQVTVTDFGIARTLAGTKITTAHAVMGTALYMAPEQAEGLGTTPACDLYSMGVLSYELLTGELPFTGETAIEIVLKHVREPAPGLAERFPAAVREVVAKALAKRPGDRFADAAEMAAAARAAVGSEEPGARLAGLTTRTAAVGAAVGVAKAAEEAAVPEVVDVPDVAEVVEAAVQPVEPVVVGAAQAATAAVAAPWHRRRSSLVAAAVAAVLVVAGTVTVLHLDSSAGQVGANRPGASGPAPAGSPSGSASVSASAPASASVSAPAASSAAPSGADSPSAPAGPPASGGNGGAAAGGAAGGGNAGGSGNGGGNGGAAPVSGGSKGGGAAGGTGTGSSAGAGGGTPPGSSGGTKPTTPPPPANSRPAGCESAHDITNVGDGSKLGLSSDNISAGNKVVSGGYSSWGWVYSLSAGQQVTFHACSAGGPPMGVPVGSSVIELVGNYGTTTFGVTSAGGGTYTLHSAYLSTYCLTSHGSGTPVTLDSCDSSGAQQWRIP
ncbi:serine/threonine-protein kinase [Streptomyces tateyamensis]|uniref:serine/threonine-protein kinase n=1 Tax=Streptomyces tateyamensis TaxID=565073 RepID=UPI0015E8A8F6|nr:serine/threonine-protein kinase [Streptomyces tateyamensis]